MTRAAVGAAFLLLFALNARADDSSGAAKAIWRHSKKWKMTATRPGSSKGERVKIGMVLTGKLKGRVADFTAEVKILLDKKPCTVKFVGELENGIYAFQKKTAYVGGLLKVKQTSSTCKLPDEHAAKMQLPQLFVKFYLTKSRLCPGIGAKPLTTKDCFTPRR